MIIARDFTLLMLLFCAIVYSVQAQNVVVRPVEIDDVLVNPHIGFSTFQMFNGDNLKANQDVLKDYDLSRYQPKDSSFQNVDHPMTSIAYFRLQWNFVEPVQGEYRWDFIDALLDTAHARGQTIFLRISPYKWRQDEDVPIWYRTMVGPHREFAHEKWVVDPEDPRYAKYFGAMIRALGNRYDGHPDLENVDVSIVGWAGEGGGTELLSKGTMQKLLDPYIESFKITPLTVLIHGEEANDYITSQATVGWRQDCLGDLGFFAEEQNGWTHMHDYYPQTIIKYDMQNAWEKAPITFEICGTFKNWDATQEYTNDQVQYIIDQSLKWHVSTFNAKSSAVPEKWKPMIDQWLKKMGYRFVLRRFSFSEVVSGNGKLAFESWWENKGVAPCYRKYPLAIRLRNAKVTKTFLTDADITTWLPGDNLFNGSFFIPTDMAPGDYQIELALVEMQSKIDMAPEPAIKLAIEGKTPDGWYDMGKITIN